YATNDAESDDSVDDVNDLQDDDDGRWDEIHNLRNIYDGDMVGLVTSNAYEDFCGRAYGFDYTDPDNMFQVTEVNCILGNFTFAHEFGHLQGLRHDNDDDTDPFDYAHGFNTLVDFRTIMALNDDDNPSQRINIWSDPDIVFPGTATVAGTSDFNDNSRALNFGESTVIAHRLTPNSITLNETIGDDEYADMVTFEQITAQNFTAENGSMVILRAGDEVRLVPGFHAESGSDGQFFIDGVCTLAPPRPGLVTNDPAPTSRPGDLSTTEPTASLTRTPTLTLFPNPTANQIQLRYELTEEQVVSIQVIDALGASVGLVQAETLRSRNPISDTGHEDENLRETFSPAGVQQKTIDVSSWAPGVYTVIIQTAKGRMVEQFMVIR
ncbi:MAG: 3-coathanger stack domain-containing protein, partial [Bacteroidota bacterium]